MTIYSHTYLENLALCEAAGRAQLGPRYQKAGPAREGQAAHAVREAYAQHLLKEGLPSDVEWATDKVAQVLALLPAEECNDIASDLIRWIRDWDASYFLGGTAQALEERHWLTLDGDEVQPERVMSVTAPLFAYTADHVWVGDGELNVLDFKSGRIIEHTAHPSTNVQLKRYAAAEAIRRGWTGPVRVHIEHMRHSYREEALLEEDWRAVWETEVSGPVIHWDGRMGEDAGYCVGGHCADCDVRGRCNVYQTYGYDEDELFEDGAALLEARAILTEKLGWVNTRLKVLLEGGPVANETHEAVLKEKETLAFDTAKLRPALLEVLTDEQVDLAFTATKTSVSKALTKAGMKPAARKELLPVLVEKAGSTTMSTTLSVTKRKKPRDAGAVDSGD